LVDDDEINREVVLSILSEGGLVVDVAVNGAEALRRVVARRYDVVLMDMQMPVMDGLAAARAIRALPELGELPLVAMTASAMARDRERCLAAGMNDHLAKPVDPAVLRRTLRRWIRARRGAAPPPGEVRVDIDGLDAEGSIRRLGVKRSFYLAVLRKFVATHADDMRSIRSSLAAGKLEVATRAAHTLRGVAADIGATHVEALAAAVEQALSHGAAADEVEGRLDALGSALASLIAALRAKLPSETSAAGP
jgi:two-component system sensor histidine kinase/response regulator